MEVVTATATNLFVGSEQEARQVVRVTVRDSEGDSVEPARVWVEGDLLGSVEPVSVGPLRPGEQASLEIGVQVDEGASPGQIPRGGGRRRIRRRIGSSSLRLRGERAGLAAVHGRPLPLRPRLVEHPGRLHRDLGQRADPYRGRLPGAAASRWSRRTSTWPGADPDYKFVLAELDYLKPYWDVYPGGPGVPAPTAGARAGWSSMGGTYNEPNTNLTSAESTIRNAIYGVGYQRDVLGASPGDRLAAGRLRPRPAVPGDHGRRRRSRPARGRAARSTSGGPTGSAVRPGCRPRMAPANRRMQFPTEFDWIAPSGRGAADRASWPTTTRPAGGWTRRPPWSRPRREVHRAVHRSWRRVGHPQRPAAGGHRLFAAQPVADRRSSATGTRRYVWPRFLSGDPARVLRRRPRRDGGSRAAGSLRRHGT